MHVEYSICLLKVMKILLTDLILVPADEIAVDAFLPPSLSEVTVV